jgi:phosphoribosylformimino-5-aminoimidazole carboxamide ribotide isomerase
MILFPAIDLKDNHCVRLIQGDMKQYKVYSDRPVDVALDFQLQGANYLHVVDLNRTTNGSQVNIDTIKMLIQNIDIPIQIGGGVRSLNDASQLLSLGVDRIIVGTIAINDFDLLKKMVATYKDQIVVSIDAKNGMVATHGWQSVSDIDALDLCQKLESIGIKTIVYTDIAKDGMLEGPNFADYERLKRNTNLNIIASGGIASLNDIVRLNNMNIYGTIIGKALYEKRFTLKEALTCLQNASYPV